MTKNERIQQLEKLIADLSYRLYRLELERYNSGYVGIPLRRPYVYYGTSGAVQHLGNFSNAASTGSVQDAPQTSTAGLEGNGGTMGSGG